MGWQLVEFPVSGYDEGTSARRTPKFLSLVNYRWAQKGRVDKRYGYGTIATSIFGDAYSNVASATVTSGGSGYTGGSFAASVHTTGGGGAGFAGAVGETGGVLNVGAVAIFNNGYGYTSTPTLGFTPTGGGSGATGTATLSTPTGGGGNLAATCTLCASPLGALEVSDGTTVYRLADQGWIPLGSLATVGVTTSPLPIVASSANSSTSLQAKNWDVVYANGYQLFGFECFGYNGILALDEGTGAIVAGPPTGTSAPLNAPVAVSDGTRYVWFFFEQGSGFNELQFIPVDVSTTPPTIGTTPITFTTTTATPKIIAFDVQWVPQTSELVFLYQINGTSNVTIATYTYDNSGLNGFFNAVSSFNAGACSGTAVCSVAVGPTTGNVYYAFAYVQSGNVFVYACRTDLHATIGNVQVYTASTSVTAISNLSVVESNANGSEFHVAFTATDAAGIDQVRSFKIAIGGTFISPTQTVTAGTLTCGLTLASRMYNPTGSAHALTYSLAAQGYFVSDLTGTDPGLTGTQAVPLASINPRVAFGAAGGLSNDIRSGGSLVSIYEVDGVWKVPVTIASDPGVTQALNLQQATITYGLKPTPAVPEWTSMFYPSGIPTVVGSEQVFEACFLAPPVILSTAVTTGAGVIAPGQYAYVACFERVADDGSIVRSPPSLPVNVTLSAAATQIAITVTTYSLGKANTASEDINGAFVVLYRTQTDGTEFFRVSAEPFNFGTAIGSAQNTPEVSNLTITDTVSSDTIGANPALYTAGGVFSNVCPSSCTMATRVRDRIYASGTPDQLTVYYSDSVTSTGNANWHDEQTLTVDDGGPITGLGALDFTTILFKERLVFRVDGSEGGPTGANNTLTTPTIVQTGGIGCVAPRSVVTTPNGLMFQSTRGIELLDRNFAVTWIGDAVQNELGSSTVVAAVLVPEQEQVRFYTDGPNVLVFSTLSGEWSVYTYPSLATTLDAVNVNGSVYWTTVGGTIQQETVGAWSDAGAWITSSFQTGWMTFNGVEGYRNTRVAQVLFTYGEDSGMSLSLFADYSPTPMQPAATWTSTQVDAVLTGTRVQLEVWPALRKVEAFSVSGTDSAPISGSPTAGLGIDGFAFEVAQKEGRYRPLPAGAKR